VGLSAAPYACSRCETEPLEGDAEEERDVIEEESTAGNLDFGALREAIEDKDPDLLLGFYAEDAELRVVNGALPEGAAFELKGRGQIERYLRAVCDQQMTCVVEDDVSGEVVSGEGSMTFGEVCEYPEGSSVSVETTLEIAKNSIVRQTDVARSARREDRSER
jgi:hypothetical protein